MKHWIPGSASEQDLEAEPLSRDAWITWLNHAPLHGVTPDLHKPKAGWAGFGVLATLCLFWSSIAWAVFGR